jgi:hypothetical protein
VKEVITLMTTHAIVGLAAHVLAIDATGQHLSDTVRTAGGNFFLAVLAILGGWQLLKRHLIGAITLLAVAAVTGVFVWFPNTVHDLTGAVVSALGG